MKKIIVLTAVFAMVFAGTALAADWNFYGSSRVGLFSNTISKEMSPVTGQDFTTTTYAQQGNSRIGANVAAGDVSGRFEYGTGVNLRLLYGTWNFGGGEMSVGQMYNPTYYAISNSVFATDNNLGSFGNPFTRQDQIEFKFGGFKIAAVEPTMATIGTYSAGTRITIPKIEAAWDGTVGPVKLGVSGGWQTYEAFNATDDSKSVTSMLGQVYAKYNAGPMYLAGSFAYGVNTGNYGIALFDSTDDAAGFANGEVKDTTSMGFAIVAGFTVNDMIGLEAGYGYVTSSYDNAISNKDDIAMDYYFQVPLTLADGVFIVPEVGVWDYDKDNADNKEGKITYLGAKFQINF
jgi:hypothetical protein